MISLLLLLLLLPQPAYAYIDPGSGSLVLQWLIAAAVGGWLAVRLSARNFWKKLRGGKGLSKASDDETAR
jgi:hypothetical protein